MKKRQKYDPRKAIEEAKKGAVKEEKEYKSAFPEGMLPAKAPTTPRDNGKANLKEEQALKTTARES